jgi:hypothetical protein
MIDYHSIEVQGTDYDTSTFVTNPFVGIENHQYGDYKKEVDDSGNVTYPFHPSGSAVYVIKILADIILAEIYLVLKYISVTGQLVTVVLSGKYLNENDIVTLSSKGVQVTKRSADTLIKTIFNQCIGAKVDYIYKHIGFGIHMGQRIFMGYKAIGTKAKYNGKCMIKPTGSKDKWLDLVRSLVGYTPIEVALSIGFSATLYAYLKAYINLEGILFHAYGESSGGKSTVAMLIVSCGAYPDFDKQETMMLSWGSTENSIIASLRNNFGYPVAIDEASLLKQLNKTSFLYNLIMGREKGRCNKDSDQRESSSWDTIIFSTGEHSLNETADDNSGLGVRNYELENVPWCKSADMSDTIKSVVKENYGWATPMIAEYLLSFNESDKTSEIIDIYYNWKNRFIERAVNENSHNPFTVRLASKQALIPAAAEIASKALGIPFNYDAIFDFMYRNNALLSADNDNDIGIRMYDFIMANLEANPNKVRYPQKCVDERKSDATMPNEIWASIDVADTPYHFNDGIRMSFKSAIIPVHIFDMLISKKKKNKGTRVILKHLRDADLLVSLSDRFKSRKKLKSYGSEVDCYELRIVASDDEILDWKAKCDREEKRKNRIKKKGDTSLSQEKINSLLDDDIDCD